MSFTIIRDRNRSQARITGDKGHLVGLITSTNDLEHRVELMMKIDHVVRGNFDAAIAYARGAEAAMRAFNVIPKEGK